jgi:uncharacterized Ntn-hydrolase superfamily protein
VPTSLNRLKNCEIERRGEQSAALGALQRRARERRVEAGPENWVSQVGSRSSTQMQRTRLTCSCIVVREMACVKIESRNEETSGPLRSTGYSQLSSTCVRTLRKVKRLCGQCPTTLKKTCLFSPHEDGR